MAFHQAEQWSLLLAFRIFRTALMWRDGLLLQETGVKYCLNEGLVNGVSQAAI